MDKLLEELEKELSEVELHYDFCDNSKEKQKMIDMEKRQINRLIKLVRILCY
jgi:hypothetical protein